MTWLSMFSEDELRKMREDDNRLWQGDAMVYGDGMEKWAILAFCKLWENENGVPGLQEGLNKGTVFDKVPENECKKIGDLNFILFSPDAILKTEKGKVVLIKCHVESIRSFINDVDDEKYKNSFLVKQRKQLSAYMEFKNIKYGILFALFVSEREENNKPRGKLFQIYNEKGLKKLDDLLLRLCDGLPFVNNMEQIAKEAFFKLWESESGVPGLKEGFNKGTVLEEEAKYEISFRPDAILETGGEKVVLEIKCSISERNACINENNELTGNYCKKYKDQLLMYMKFKNIKYGILFAFFVSDIEQNNNPRVKLFKMDDEKERLEELDKQLLRSLGKKLPSSLTNFLNFMYPQNQLIIY